MQNKSSISSRIKSFSVTQSLLSQGLPALYSVAFLSGLSLGLFNPFISMFMTQHGIDDVWIGANATVYFLAIGLGTPFVIKVLRQIGLRRTLILGFAIMGSIAPLFPLTTQLPLWFLIRAIMGIASSFYLVSGQTGLNSFCQEKNRAIVSGIYSVTFSFGFALSPVLGSILFKVSPQITFCLGGILILSGILVVWFWMPEKLIVFQPSINSQLFARLKLPLQGAFSYGFSIATFIAIYPVYLLRQNYAIAQIGYIFSLFVIGGLLATVPLTHLADRLGRLKIILFCTCLVVISIIGLAVNTNAIAIPILAFITGASMSPIFPLSLALIGEKLPFNELSSGSALFTATYSAGCTTGPLLSAITMSVFGGSYLFLLMLLIFVFFLFNSIKQYRHSHLAL
jgi:MFS family permease